MEQQRPADSVERSAPVRQTFGRYELLGLLGQGGMGHLYVAERRGIQGFAKTVALKRILPHLADSSQLREMFLNEARTAARLEHPNIVATYELGEVDGQYFISMEYLPGEDLSAVIARCQGAHPIPIEIAAALAQQAAQGLHYAHEARDVQGRPINLVHRDVNPRNIFVTYHGVVKLLDFGVVRGAPSTKSIPGVFKGKYGYCAPEQLEGGRVDRRTDVFCLGIALWECLTGTRLFDAGSEVLAIDAVRSRRVDAPSALRPEVPRALDDIALRALNRDPAQRYQSAQDMSEDLEHFLLQRDERPTSKSIGRWLESIFGAERAALKKAISQGGAADGNLDRLVALDASRPATGEGSGPASGARRPQPRAVWSTSFGTGSLPSRASTPSQTVHAGSSPGAVVDPAARARPAVGARPSGGRRAISLTLVAAAGLIAGGIFILRGQDATLTSGTAPAGQATASLDLRSQPPGADIFIDGSPSGFKTPAVLTGLPVGRSLRIGLDRQGYEPVADQTTLAEGPTRTLSFTLRAAIGTVRLVAPPANASAFLDDKPVDVSKPFTAPAGKHKLRVEAESLSFSRTIEVRAGAETVLSADDGRSRP
jgi:serine/threonine protein kinase